LVQLVDPRLMLPTIAQVLGLQELGDRALEQTLREYLRERHLLLLLDNFEQLTAAAAQVGTLLGECPHLKVLVTSRVPLHLRGEKEYPIVPLALPPLQAQPPSTTRVTPGPPLTAPTDAIRARAAPGMVERLTQYAAVALFIQRALDARPDFQVT